MLYTMLVGKYPFRVASKDIQSSMGFKLPRNLNISEECNIFLNKVNGIKLTLHVVGDNAKK